MLNPSELVFFVSTIFLISISPGLCMSLALSLGIQVGFWRTTFMMFGELLGVGLVAAVALAGVGTVMQTLPWLFEVLKYFGAGFLIWMGVKGWQNSKQITALHTVENVVIRRRELFLRGFITAVSNPKGWAFSASFLPAFIAQEASFLIQSVVIISIFLLSELICMCIYAGGGHAMRRYLSKESHFVFINRLSACLLIVVAGLLLSQ